MSEPNPYAPPVVEQPQLPEGRQLVEDERSAWAHATWALGFAIFSFICPPFVSFLAIFLAWRALQLCPTRSGPAKRAVIAICLSIVFGIAAIGLAVWQLRDASRAGSAADGR